MSAPEPPENREVKPEGNPPDERAPDAEGDLPPPPSMRDVRSAEALVEVFHVGDPQGASAAIDEILAPAGIEAFRHDRRSHALPVPAGEVAVAVDRSVADEARRLLREALTDGALPEGEVVGDEGPAIA